MQPLLEMTAESMPMSRHLSSDSEFQIREAATGNAQLTTTDG